MHRTVHTPEPVRNKIATYVTRECMQAEVENTCKFFGKIYGLQNCRVTSENDFSTCKISRLLKLKKSNGKFTIRTKNFATYIL